MRAFQWRAVCAVLLACWAPWAHALVFAVNEGVTYKVSNEELAARYAAIGADLARILKQPVTVEPVGSYAALRQGLADKRFDLAMVHPAHISIGAILHSGYHLVAVTRGFEDYRAQFLVRADSPLQAMADLKGQQLGAPEEDSITSVMVRAALRDAGLRPGQVSIVYTRYQEAVPFFVDNKLTTAGATAAAPVVKAWTEHGGKVLASSRAVPIKHIIASPSLSPEQIDSVRAYLLGLDGSDEGRKTLAPTRYAGFARYDEAALLKIGTWLGL